jgi:hypothetical protein
MIDQRGNKFAKAKPMRVAELLSGVQVESPEMNGAMRNTLRAATSMVLVEYSNPCGVSGRRQQEHHLAWSIYYGYCQVPGGPPLTLLVPSSKEPLLPGMAWPKYAGVKSLPAPAWLVPDHLLWPEACAAIKRVVREVNPNIDVWLLPFGHFILQVED